MMCVSNNRKKITPAIMAIILAMPILLIASNNNYIGDFVKKKHEFNKPITLKDTVDNERFVIGIDIRNHDEMDAHKEKRESAKESVSSSASQNVESIIVNGVTFKMIHVAGGRFIMGATDEQEDDAYSYESPTHVVNLSSFSIGETEVTQELWQAIMDYNPSRYTGDLNRPVETVSWDDCQAFIFKLNQLTGKRFRLPTEAEWEYAARGGSNSNGYKYAGGNDANSVSWNSDNSGDITHSVGSKTPNELGVFDMSGNVIEWCQDGYSYYYNLGTDTLTNPWGQTSIEFGRVCRGGSFNDINRDCRVSSRFSNSTDYHSFECGFRLALSELSGYNISFMKEVQQIMATQSTAIIPIALSRGNINGNYTAHVTLGEPRPDNVSLQNQWITFANGERIAYAYIVFSDMEAGNTYNCKLNLSKADEATANPEYGPQILMTSVEVTHDYNWIPAGTCTFTDYTFGDGVVGEDIMIENGEGSNFYRIVAPYYYTYPDDGASKDNITFTLNNDGSISMQEGDWFNLWGYGFYYDTVNWGDYCYVLQDGNAFDVNFLLKEGGAVTYTAEFMFEWHR